jgi:alkylation response protein AidB-like acyl-CoA dehydrogenase
MNFTLTDDQRALQDSVRQFAQRELPDIARQIEESDEPPSLELRKRFAELGYLGVNLPTEYGGGGMSHFDAVLVLEELAKISIAVAFPIFESCFGPTLAIAHFGSEAMKQRVLPKVCAGEMVVACGDVGAGCRLCANRPDDAGAARRRTTSAEWQQALELRRRTFGSLCSV